VSAYPDCPEKEAVKLVSITLTMMTQTRSPSIFFLQLFQKKTQLLRINGEVFCKPNGLPVTQPTAAKHWWLGNEMILDSTAERS